MNIENYIESQYREILSFGPINPEYLDLYKPIKHQKLREILTTLHHDFTTLFKLMNERLPTPPDESYAHFWAEPSRDLIKRLDIVLGLTRALKDSPFAFEIDEYYSNLFNTCQTFLSSSGGSTLPPGMAKIELYYTIPIFKPLTSITVPQAHSEINYELKLIGDGSYANVYKYKDTFYNRFFILKRAKKDLTDKELARFKREFDVMKNLSSPYVLDVYRYHTDKNEYIMEYMDYTLDSYITKYNSSLSLPQRKGIVKQILHAFNYIHSQKILHRDISPNNILIKKYADVIVVKIADFGLVKIPESSLTSFNTEFKGSFNDPALVLDGFESYNILHETYALTRIVYFVMTGKTNTTNIKNSKLQIFVEKGLNPDYSKRFQNVQELMTAFQSL